jgi:hypothetical protein
MLVKELIVKLKKMPQDLPVEISDGYACNFYAAGDWLVEVIDDVEKDGEKVVEIAVGGFLRDQDEGGMGMCEYDREGEE